MEKVTNLKGGIFGSLFMPTFLVVDDASCFEKAQYLIGFHRRLRKASFTL